MVESIDVFVDPPKVEVSKPKVQASKGDVVVWNIHRLSRNVEWVGIVFDNPDAKYFMNGSGSPAGKHTPKGKKKGLTNWEIVPFFHGRDHAHIMGVSPGLVKKSPNYTLRNDKYSIKCWFKQPKNEKVKADWEIDPEIVTCDP